MQNRCHSQGYLKRRAVFKRKRDIWRAKKDILETGRSVMREEEGKFLARQHAGTLILHASCGCAMIRK